MKIPEPVLATPNALMEIWNEGESDKTAVVTRNAPRVESAKSANAWAMATHSGLQAVVRKETEGPLTKRTIRISTGRPMLTHRNMADTFDTREAIYQFLLRPDDKVGRSGYFSSTIS